MKKNNGMGHIKLIVMIIFIAVLIATGVYFLRLKLNEVRIETMKTNMLLVEWKIKDYISKKNAAGEEVKYVGTKVFEMKDELIVSKFLEKNIIKEEDYENYYVLTDSDLSELTLEITNDRETYYIVNYETDDILNTKGCEVSNKKILYRLSDIEKATEENNQNMEKDKVEENEQNSVQEKNEESTENDNTEE